MDGIFNDRPALGISREIGCPFPRDVCHDDAQPILLEHKDIPLRQFGVNSKSRVLMSHRLTCSPLKAEPFLYFSEDSENSILAFCDLDYPGIEEFADDYRTKIFSRNGPNQYSNQRSGQIAARANRAYHLEIFPRSHVNISESWKRIHPALRGRDGTVFVVAYRAGLSYYDYPIDDPFFAAHDPFPNQKKDPVVTVYFPDYEITAMGCVEQYQFCVHQEPAICTPWGGQQDNMIPLFKILIDLGDPDSAYDLTLFHLNLVDTATVQRYLLARRGTQSLLSSQYRSNKLINCVDAKEQWVAEVTAWFETAFLQARYGEFRLLQRDRPPREFPEEIISLRKVFEEVCNRILFFDGKYTNINFVQLMIILSCLTLPWLASFRHEIAAISSKIAGFCWWMLKRGISYGRTGVVSAISWIKSAHRSAQPASGMFPYSSFWSRPDNRHLHDELNDICMAARDIHNPDGPGLAVHHDVPQNTAQV